MSYIDNDVAQALFQGLLDEGYSEDQAIHSMDRSYTLEGYEGFSEWVDNDMEPAEPEYLEKGSYDAPGDESVDEALAQALMQQAQDEVPKRAFGFSDRDSRQTFEPVGDKEESRMNEYDDRNEISASMMIFQDAVKRLDAAFKKAPTTMAALAVLEDTGLPFQVGTAPVVRVNPIVGDFSRAFDEGDGTLMRSTCPSGRGVQYTIRAKGELRDFWIVLTQ